MANLCCSAFATTTPWTDCASLCISNANPGFTGIGTDSSVWIFLGGDPCDSNNWVLNSLVILSETQRPFQIIGTVGEATNADDVPNSADIFHTGNVIIGDISSVLDVKFLVKGSVAFGANTHVAASGANSAIINGDLNDSSGINSLVGGYANSAKGNNSVVFGAFNTVDVLAVNSAIIGGQSNDITGFVSTIIGSDASSVDGDNSAVIGGSFNSISGDDSIATGTNATVSHNYAWVHGTGVNIASSADGQVVMNAIGGFIFLNNTDQNAGFSSATGVAGITVISSERAKENIREVSTTGILEKFKTLRVAKYKMKHDPISIANSIEDLDKRQKFEAQVANQAVYPDQYGIIAESYNELFAEYIEPKTVGEYQAINVMDAIGLLAAAIKDIANEIEGIKSKK